MKIPLYRPFLGEEEIKAARDVIESGVLARGKLSSTPFSTHSF